MSSGGGRAVGRGGVGAECVPTEGRPQVWRRRTGGEDGAASLGGHPGATCTPRSPDLGSWGSARRRPCPRAAVALGPPRGRPGVSPGARLHLLVDQTLNLPSLGGNSIELRRPWGFSPEARRLVGWCELQVDCSHTKALGSGGLKMQYRSKVLLVGRALSRNFSCEHLME